MSMTLVDLATVTLIATCGATLIFLVTRVLDHSERRVVAQSLSHSADPVFLFENNVLSDATHEALDLIAPLTGRMSELDAMLQVLSSRFPDLCDIVQTAKDGKTRITAEGDDALSVEVDRAGQRLRIAVHGEQDPATISASNVIERDMRDAELNMLREFTRHSPQMIWQEDSAGKLLWANDAYLSLFDKLHGKHQNDCEPWPNVTLFPDMADVPLTNDRTMRRLAVSLPDKKAEHWFDVTRIKRADSQIFFASDANATVRAEQAQRNFVQTLGKTFADLSIGLAIFDKRRQLAMFNPALVDLTNLKIEFLSGRPTVDTVLDRLRESRMLPEPKNYTSWRDQFLALEEAAKNGTYSENWNLPDGQTYRVTGRPHPDGAVAFLFEDISAEISLTRRFRSEIETSQAVLDTLPEAIAVFSSAGTLVMSNAAYNGLWGTVSEGAIQHHELRTELQVWQSRCTATRMWSDLRTFVYQLGTRQPWADSAILEDGRHVRCHASPIAGGMTMVKFVFEQPMKPVIQKLTQADIALTAGKR